MNTFTFIKPALAALVVTAGVNFGFSSTAQAEVLTCPASIQLKTQNTPRGWAATIPAQLFQSAHIKPSGNRKELRCQYSNGAKITKLVPLNTQCRVTNSGFDCAAIEAAAVAPPIHLRTDIWLAANQTGDLDTGQNGGAGADVLYGVQGLEALRGARFSDIATAGDYTVCSRIRKNVRLIRRNLLQPGARFCATLGSGRLASIVVSERNNQNMRLRFRTWSQQ